MLRPFFEPMPTPQSHSTIAAASRRLRRRFILFLLLLALVVCAVVAFRGAGRWLIYENPLRRADVIVVLSGSMPARAEEAARLFRAGYAPEVWVSRPLSPAAELAQMGVHYIGEEDFNREVLVHQGVPESAVHVFPDAIVDTEQEVSEISREMRLEGKTTAIIVTSRQHTRRVRALWSKLVGKNPAAIVRGAPQDPFDADRWWSNTRDALSVVREILGLLNVWTGLHVRPHTT